MKLYIKKIAHHDSRIHFVVRSMYNITTIKEPDENNVYHSRIEEFGKLSVQFY